MYFKNVTNDCSKKFYKKMLIILSLWLKKVSYDNFRFNELNKFESVRTGSFLAAAVVAM